MSTQISGTSGVIFPDSSTQNTAATGFGFKNRIINGAMMIDQRNAGASVTVTASNFYSLDRWNCETSVFSKLSIQRNAGAVTPPAGFINYLGLTSLSAYSVASTDYFMISQFIEGYNVADLAWGSASAQAVTLSFKVYSSLTGTFGGSISNAANNRTYPFTYTVSSANTWTTVAVTIPGDTTGTWATDNTTGIKVRFGLGVGSTYSGAAGAWSGSTYFSATGAQSVVGTNGATFYITGIQLEKGSTATSFDYRDYGRELQMCQRYYQNYPNFGVDAYSSALQEGTGRLCFPVTMRASPTVAQPGTPSLTSNTSLTSYIIGAGSNDTSLLAAVTATALGRVYLYRSITCSAEL